MESIFQFKGYKLFHMIIIKFSHKIVRKRIIFPSKAHILDKILEYKATET